MNNYLNGPLEEALARFTRENAIMITAHFILANGTSLAIVWHGPFFLCQIWRRVGFGEHVLDWTGNCGQLWQVRARKEAFEHLELYLAAHCQRRRWCLPGDYGRVGRLCVICRWLKCLITIISHRWFGDKLEQSIWCCVVSISRSTCGLHVTRGVTFYFVWPRRYLTLNVLPLYYFYMEHFQGVLSNTHRERSELLVN